MEASGHGRSEEGRAQSSVIENNYLTKQIWLENPRPIPLHSLLSPLVLHPGPRIPPFPGSSEKEGHDKVNHTAEMEKKKNHVNFLLNFRSLF